MEALQRALLVRSLLISQPQTVAQVWRAGNRSLTVGRQGTEGPTTPSTVWAVSGTSCAQPRLALSTLPHVCCFLGQLLLDLKCVLKAHYTKENAWEFFLFFSGGGDGRAEGLCLFRALEKLK